MIELCLRFRRPVKTEWVAIRSFSIFRRSIDHLLFIEKCNGYIEHRISDEGVDFRKEEE